jgi:hypothetical protein
MSVEKFSAMFINRAVRYGMSVENTGYQSNSVPSGTECGDCHIAYLTARGKSVAVYFSTNILSPPGQRNHYMLFISRYWNIELTEYFSCPTYLFNTFTIICLCLFETGKRFSVALIFFRDSAKKGAGAADGRFFLRQMI